MMKSLVCASLLAVTATGLAQLDHQDVLLVTHQSKVLNQERSYYVYLPESNDLEERFPVTYVLHGKWGSHTDWLERGNAAEVAERYRMILVFPDGGQFSWYLDSVNEEDSDVFTYLTEELVDHIDNTYRTIPKKEARAIMGLSMGGHAAMNAAIKRPDRYASASSLSGVLRLMNHSGREHVIRHLGHLEGNSYLWQQWSAFENAEALATADVRILFDCGEDDTKTGVITDNREFAERLDELRIPHLWREHTGTHSWDYWSEHLHEHLNFHQAVMSEAFEQDRWVQHYFERLDQFYAENEALELEERDPSAMRISLFGSSGLESITGEFLPEQLEDGTRLRFFNRGIASDRLGIDARGLSRRMEASVFDLDPDIVVINNGTNDIGELHRSTEGHPSIDRMEEEFRNIVMTINDRAPDIHVVITACAPTRGRFAHLNESILEYNSRLRKIAEDTGSSFVDSHTPTVNDEGELKESYTTDGLHFGPEAKELFVSLVIDAIEDRHSPE